jgi:hypothetical protein
VKQAAAHLEGAWPVFDGARFSREAQIGLDALDLKARAMQICDTLQATLPADVALAADVIEAHPRTGADSRLCV